MVGKFYFYYKQGKKTALKSWMTIVALSLAVSLVVGMNFYLDSYKKQALNESLNNIVDVSYRKSFEYDFEKGEIEDLDLEFKPHLMNVMRDNNFALDYLGEVLFVDPRLTSNLFQDEEYLSVPLSIFNTSRFKDHFSLLAGEFPTAENEICISLSNAESINASVGDQISIRYETSEHVNRVHGFNATATINVSISGIYIPHDSVIQIGRHYFRFAKYLNKETSEIETKLYEYHGWVSDLIFSYTDFENSNFTHPLKSMIQQISSNLFNEKDEEYRFGYFSHEILGFFDRSSISPNSLISFGLEMNEKADKIEEALEPTEFYDDYLIIDSVSFYLDNIKWMRLVLQIINIPIFLFAIFLSVFAVKMNTKERLDEFLLLRSKGIPSSMIRTQFLVEATLIGTISGGIAVFGGIPVFMILKSFFYRFLGTALRFPLQLQIGIWSIVTGFIIGILLVLIASIPSIRYINRMESNQILAFLGTNSLDIEYDERTLFQYNPKSVVTLSDTPFLSSENQDIGINLESKGRKSKKINKKNQKSIYRNGIHRKEKNIRKMGKYLIIFSTIPLIFYGLYYWSISSLATDGIIMFIDKILPFIETLYIFAVLSPVLLVYGFIRILVIEKPSRFAKLVKLMAYPFVKRKDYLVALSMVKQKDYRRFIIICGIFFSLFSFTNIMINSTTIYDNVRNNNEVGTDVNVVITYQDFLDSVQNSSLSNIEEIEKNITEFKQFSNDSIINDVTTCFETFVWEGSSVDIRHFYGDIAKYSRMLQEGGKLHSSSVYSRSFALIDAYFALNPSNTNGVIVNEDYATFNGLSVGDQFNISQSYISSETNELLVIDFECELISILPTFPGTNLHHTYNYGQRCGIFMDLSRMDQINGTFPDYWEGNPYDNWVYQFFDVDQTILNNKTTVLSYIRALPFDWFSSSTIMVYQSDLSVQKYDDGDDATLRTFYDLLYIEFFLIGGILTIMLSIIILGVQRQNKYVSGIYLSRGMGKRGLIGLILVQLMIIFSIGIILGLLSGGVSAYIVLKLYLRTAYRRHAIDLPPFVDFGDILILTGSLIGISLLFFLLAYYIQSRKKIAEYFHKF